MQKQQLLPALFIGIASQNQPLFGLTFAPGWKTTKTPVGYSEALVSQCYADKAVSRGSLTRFHFLMSITKILALSTIGTIIAGVLFFLALIALGIILFLTQPRGPSVQDMALLAEVGHHVMGMKRSDAYSLLHKHGLVARNATSFRHLNRDLVVVDINGARQVDWPPRYMRTANGRTWKVDKVEVDYGSSEACHTFEVQTLSFGPNDPIDAVSHHPEGVCM